MGMTNEEIIKGLQAVNEHIGKHFNEGGAWMAEFIDNAIKALEQHPCEDCISREAVIKIFGEVHPMDYNTQAYITNIQNLPSVTPRAESEEMCNMTCKEMNEMAKAFYDGLIEGLEGEE